MSGSGSGSGTDVDSSTNQRHPTGSLASRSWGPCPELSQAADAATMVAGNASGDGARSQCSGNGER